MFQRYNRCPWEIEGEPEDEEDGNAISAIFSQNFVYISSKDAPPRVKFSEKVGYYYDLLFIRWC